MSSHSRHKSQYESEKRTASSEAKQLNVCLFFSVLQLDITSTVSYINARLHALLKDEIPTVINDANFTILLQSVEEMLRKYVEEKDMPQNSPKVESNLDELPARGDDIFNNLNGGALQDSHHTTALTVGDVSKQILDDVCHPILKLHFCEGIEVDRKLLSCALSTCAHCFVFVDSEAQRQHLTILLEILTRHCTPHNLGDASSSLPTSKFTVFIIEAFSRLYGIQTASIPRDVTLSLAAIIKQMLIADEEPQTGSIMALLIPRMIAHDQHLDESFISGMWSTVEGCLADEIQPDQALSRGLFILCGLFDIFFKVAESVDCSTFTAKSIDAESFWVNFQRGFYHPDPLTRKRTLYLFKRILDISERGFSRGNKGDDVSISGNVIFPIHLHHKQYQDGIWQDFLLLIETLDEKQVK